MREVQEWTPIHHHQHPTHQTLHFSLPNQLQPSWLPSFLPMLVCVCLSLASLVPPLSSSQLQQGFGRNSENYWNGYYNLGQPNFDFDKGLLGWARSDIGQAQSGTVGKTYRENLSSGRVKYGRRPLWGGPLFRFRGFNLQYCTKQSFFLVI